MIWHIKMPRKRTEQPPYEVVDDCCRACGTNNGSLMGFDVAFIMIADLA